MINVCDYMSDEKVIHYNIFEAIQSLSNQHPYQVIPGISRLTNVTHILIMFIKI